MVKAERPENSPFYIVEYIERGNVFNNHYDYSNELTKSIDKIEPGETKEVEFLVDTSMSMIDEDLIFRAVITAENTLEDSSAMFENKIIEGTLQLKISSSQYKEDVKLGQKLTYYLTVENNSNSEMNNLNVDINIPKYLKLEEYENGAYNEKTRTLTYNAESFKGRKTYTIKATVESSENINQEIEMQAIGKYDGQEKEIKSNRYVKTVQDTKGFNATLSSNITGRMIDTDTVEYYINVKNDSKKTAQISVYDNLPNELQIESYVVKNGNKGYTLENTGISQAIQEEVKAGDNLKITVIAKPYILDSVGQVKEIENKVEVKINGEELGINTIKQEIEGTSNFNTEKSENIQEESESIYTISGKVWYDENKNSKYDENETGMSKIPVRLYNVNTQKYITNEKGEPLEINTNDNGEYKFKDLSNGDYIVEIIYDNKVYKLSNYQVSELSQNENSDFIESKVEGATSNIITVKGENIYNTDLGLVDIDNFNISINNKISKISTINGRGTKEYKIDSDNVNIKINDKENTTLVIEYLIDVVNEGNIDGYVTKIVNPISKGMRFASELNSDWYIDDEGNAVNTSIANTLIKVGEKLTLKLVLIEELNKNSKELVGNTVEIKETYNQYGIKEVSTKELASVKRMTAQIIVNKDNTTIKVIGISLSIIALLTLAGIIIYKVMNKEEIWM